VASTPYGAIAHRHRPEIQQAVGVPVVFQPHLGPFARGILATIHVRTPNAVGEPDVMHAIASSLGAEPFVRILGSAGPDGGGVMPNVASVQHTNFIDVAWAFEPDVYNDGCGHLIVYSAIDNLTKGASGQAVQCINAAIGLPETAGLLPSHASKGAATCA
jgi:N-acetyl-gamma-glutamyl-phosphate reductase